MLLVGENYPVGWGGSSMFIRCRYCEHDNPAGSTFCSACGRALALHAPPPAGSPPADPVRAAANQPRTGRQPAKSQEANAGESALFRPEACTQAAAALGLCAAKSIQKKKPETPAVEAAIKRPTTTGG